MPSFLSVFLLIQPPSETLSPQQKRYTLLAKEAQQISSVVRSNQKGSPHTFAKSQASSGYEDHSQIPENT